jgi:peptide-methionine (S)-S-oxide reductase
MVEPIARRRSFLLSLLGIGLGAGAAGLVVTRSSSGAGREIPAPAVDEATPGSAEPEHAVLAGGCFWGVQGVYQHVDGVMTALAGYAGGNLANPDYETVSSGTTGHAESVDITFDPRRISYGRILQIFFSVAHDPTELNRQGPDVGTQYRSAIFPKNAEQERIARAYIAQLNEAHVFRAPIVTQVELNRPFTVAEDYHQDYMTLHPMQPYIAINDLPKVEDLRRLFPQRYRADPQLVRRQG